MLPYQRQQFDHLLHTAAERFVERIGERLDPATALRRLRSDPRGEGLWIDRFVDAVFADFLLDNPEGAGFVLLALKNRPLPDLPPSPTIGQQLEVLARAAFMDLLLRRVDERLEQQIGYQAMVPSDREGPRS